MMHGAEKSDSSVVAKKSANKPRSPGAESMERREGTKENMGESPASRTLSRAIVVGGLDRVRQARISALPSTIRGKSPVP